MAVTPEVRPVTSCGYDRIPLPPLPSCPMASLPQHLTPPALVRAQKKS